MPRSGSGLLDTKFVTALFAGDQFLVARLRELEEAFVPVIMLGELCFGALASARPGENLRRVQAFAAASSVLGVDEGVALHYAEIKAGLKAAGRPIPEDDIWIAATARRHDLAVITRDWHFDAVDGLAVAAW